MALHCRLSNQTETKRNIKKHEVIPKNGRGPNYDE